MGRKTALAAALLLGVGFTPVRGDWLVLLDGTRIETRGPWVSDSSLVAYYPPKGDPQVVRVVEVDREATKLVNLIAERRAAKSAAAGAAGDKPRPVIDDSMVAHVDPSVIRGKLDQEERAKAERERRAQEGLRRFLEVTVRGFNKMKVEMDCRKNYPGQGLTYQLCIANGLKE